MKKIYLLAFSVVLSSALLAQKAVPGNVRKEKTTRQNMSQMTSPRIDGVAHHSGMRDVLLQEDFQVAGTPVTDLPSGWTTNIVTQTQGTNTGTDDTVGPAFMIHDANTANGGGYWPVPAVGANNKFAGANDDDVPCDCDNILSYLQTPVVDFTSASFPAITFDIYNDGNFSLNSNGYLEISTDGTNYTMVNYPLESSGLLPEDDGNWQTIVITLFDYAGINNISFRFNWTDGGDWASGFAVDNVKIGDLDNVSLTLDKIAYGDWNQANFGLGFWDYSQIPLSQVDSVRTSAVFSNTGLHTLTGLQYNVEVLKGAASQGNWSSAIGGPLASLAKDTLSVVTTYTPDAVGAYSIIGTAVSDSVETDITDNVVTSTFQVTECTYARDMGAASAFSLLESGDYMGNLFDIYQNEDFYSIQVALGGGSTVGGTVAASIYEFLGFDANNDPILSYIDNSQTLEATVYEADLNTVNGSDFICLPFPAPVSLNAGSVYLVAVQGTDSLRIPVSGTNVWPATWVYRDSDQSYGWTSGIPMIRLIGDCDASCTIGVNEKTTETALTVQNMPNPASTSTRISYNLKGSSNVSLTVRDITGKLIESVNMGNRAAGMNTYDLNVSSYAPGLYTYTLNAGTANVTSKMIVE